MDLPEVHLLIVEDSTLDRRVVTHQLSKVSDPVFRVTEALDFNEAQQKLRAVPADVVLLDLYLPDSQGLDGLVSLAREFPAVPIVILTGTEDESLALQAFRMGAQDYLLKGQTPAPLLKRVLLYAMERKRVDITLNQHRESLRAAQRLEMMGRVAGKVAHDFNNILNTITGFADLALEDLEGHPCHDDLLEIKMAALRGVKLTKSVLQFSLRGSAGQETSRLDSVVSGIEGALRLLLPSGSQFEIELGAGERKLEADPSVLEQVLMSLVLNAGEALRSQGRVTLRTSFSRQDRHHVSTPLEPGGYLTLEIEDNGVGMDDAHRGRMFDPFFTTKAQGGGTGLGLSKVVDFVRDQRGTIQVDSRLDFGTRVTLLLPEAESVSSGETALVARSTKAVAIVLDGQLFSEPEYAEVFEKRDLAVARLFPSAVGDFVCDTTVRFIFLESHDLNEELRSWFQDLRSRWSALRVVAVAAHSDDDALHRVDWPGLEVLWRPFSPNSLNALLRTL